MSHSDSVFTSARSYLDTPLIRFSDSPIDSWTIRDAVRGVQIFGSIGSGKTSGSGHTIATKFLSHGFGGLVLCAKPGEAADWVEYAKEAGRPEKDIILFQEGSSWQFNPLQYENKRTTKGGGLTINLTELFMTIFKMGQRISGSSAEEKEKFWENSLKRCINRIIDLLKLSGEELSVYNMIEILNTTPDQQEMGSISSMKEEEIVKLGQKKFCIKCLYNAVGNADDSQKKRDCLLVYNYFTRDFPSLDDKVKSTIKEMFLGYAEPFLSGILNDHFAGISNVTPEDTFEGKIIIMDFSVKEYLVAGIYAQCLFKYLWQQVVERRKIKDDTKPVFLWVDESQYFVNEYDTIFQTTARSSRACTVFLTQNISNYYAQMGGHDSNAKVDSLIGNLSTIIFHANNNAETNEYASRLIGQELQTLASAGVSRPHFSLEKTESENLTTSYLPQIQPKEFTVLKSGGQSNNFKVQGILMTSGRQWGNGKNYVKVSFTQHFKDKT